MPKEFDETQLDFGDPELNDPNYGNEPTQDGNDGTSPQQAPDGQAQQGGDQGATPAQPQPVQDGAGNQQGGTPDTTGQQQQQQPQQSAPTRTKADKDGNLVDDKGNIVAAAGAERRTYERVQAQQRHIDTLERDLAEANRKADLTQALNGAPQALGLNHEDVQMGLQTMAAFKKDPVTTARWLLQETMRLGYDLKQIIGNDANGQLNSNTLDLGAVRQMINEAINPLVSDRNAQQQEQEAQQNAQREYNRFMASHDYANVHEGAIAQLVQTRRVTPEVAYWQLQAYAASNGLDFTQPLGPQVQARQQGGPAPNGNANPQAQTQHQQPMPNGGAPTQDMQQGPTMANADDAWENIIKQSMQESGLQY